MHNISYSRWRAAKAWAICSIESPLASVTFNRKSSSVWASRPLTTMPCVPLLSSFSSKPADPSDGKIIRRGACSGDSAHHNWLNRTIIGCDAVSPNVADNPRRRHNVAPLRLRRGQASASSMHDINVDGPLLRRCWLHGGATALYVRTRLGFNAHLAVAIFLEVLHLPCPGVYGCKEPLVLGNVWRLPIGAQLPPHVTRPMMLQCGRLLESKPRASLRTTFRLSRFHYCRRCPRTATPQIPSDSHLARTLLR